MAALGNIIKGLLMNHYLSLYFVFGVTFIVSFILLALTEKAETYCGYSLRFSFVSSILYILNSVLFMVVLLSGFAFCALFICTIPTAY